MMAMKSSLKPLPRNSGGFDGVGGVSKNLPPTDIKMEDE
jgi:hypothetical protein